MLTDLQARALEFFGKVSSGVLVSTAEALFHWRTLESLLARDFLQIKEHPLSNRLYWIRVMYQTRAGREALAEWRERQCKSGH